MMMMAICIMNTFAASLPEVSLTLASSALVNDSQFVLGDIADVKCSDPALTDRLMQIPLGVSAPPSFSRSIEQTEAIRRILAAAPGMRFIVNGAQRSTIVTDYQVADADEIKLSVMSYLDSMIAWPNGCWSAETDSITSDLKLYRQKASIEITGLEGNRYPKGTTRLQINIRQPSGKRKTTISCNIRVVIPVYVANGIIERGETVNRGHYRIQETDITRYAPEPVTREEQVVGKKALRTINDGTLLNSRMFAEIPVVEKGDPVTIIFSDRTIKVGIMGTARESGSTGDKIWVENRNSGKLIRVTVAGQGKVIVYKGVS